MEGKAKGIEQIKQAVTWEKSCCLSQTGISHYYTGIRQEYIRQSHYRMSIG